ncbi:MAG: Peptidylprolyl isomerase [Nocardia sp.]|uniref:peptidylprolyl isomerase n=1 Tax=Nocardia sp. TaxID=1821 RepID=UPI00260EA806|nr:peptidylprolyl isomerase [Nocardia sp.]MCU1641596.1 Peptidylprolyl isomerase [Nocardia sp.]
MPSNEQRRAAAKRKLERQVANRTQRARKRKQLTIAASALGVVVAVAAGVGIYFLTRGDDSTSTTAASETPDASLASAAPPAAKAKPATVTCDYRVAQQQPSDRQATKPATDNISTAGSPKASLQTSQGPIDIALNPGESPCTVNSFESLAKQKFFDNTSCHRMTTGKGLQVLQCGDPTASGKGGPGYAFDNEYPTDQYDPNDQAAQTPVNYKRGVIAMANAGPDQTGHGTNGSQFFLVYGDSQLPPQYTIFGTIDDAGLATLDKVAKAGVTGGGQDGKPATDVTIQSVRID